MSIIKKEPRLMSRVFDDLVTAIVARDYEEILPSQDQLALDFEVSISVIREVQTMMLAHNMLSARPKTGTRIRPISEWLLIDEQVIAWRMGQARDELFTRDVADLRALVLPKAAALAAQRASAEGIEKVRCAFRELAHSPRSTETYFEAEVQWYRQILEVSDNAFFKQMGAIIRATPPALNENGRTAPQLATCLKHHQAVLEAIERGDAEACASAMKRLLST